MQAKVFITPQTLLDLASLDKNHQYYGTGYYICPNCRGQKFKKCGHFLGIFGRGEDN